MNILFPDQFFWHSHSIEHYKFHLYSFLPKFLGKYRSFMNYLHKWWFFIKDGFQFLITIGQAFVDGRIGTSQVSFGQILGWLFFKCWIHGPHTFTSPQSKTNLWSIFNWQRTQVCLISSVGSKIIRGSSTLSPFPRNWSVSSANRPSFVWLTFWRNCSHVIGFFSLVSSISASLRFCKFRAVWTFLPLTVFFLWMMTLLYSLSLCLRILKNRIMKIINFSYKCQWTVWMN